LENNNSVANRKLRVNLFLIKKFYLVNGKKIFFIANSFLKAIIKVTVLKNSRGSVFNGVLKSIFEEILFKTNL